MLSKTEKRSLSEIAGEMYHLSSKIECYCVDYENDEDNRLLLRKINNDKGSMGIEAAVKLHVGEEYSKIDYVRLSEKTSEIKRKKEQGQAGIHE